MQEKIDLNSRDIRDNVPPLEGEIKWVKKPDEWVKEFDYPETEKKADYYVKYQTIKGTETYALIESSSKELKYKLKQLRKTGEIFMEKKLTVDMYVVVLDGLNSRSSRGYALHNSKSPYFKTIHEKQGRYDLKSEKIGKEEILLIYRQQFKEMRSAK